MALQPMYLVLWLLNFHFVTGLRHIEDAELEKIELEENHSNTAAFQFSVINNSSLPLNFLGTSQAGTDLRPYQEPRDSWGKVCIFGSLGGL